MPDLTGPQFLVLYSLLLLVALLLAYWLRATLGGPGGRSRDHGLDPYQVAYLAGGRAAAVKAAIAGLVGQGQLRFDGRRRRVFLQGDPPPPSHPLEAAVLAAASQPSGVLTSFVFKSCGAPLNSIRDSLRGLGLLNPPGNAILIRLLPVLVLGGVTVVGLVRINHGMTLGHPVEYLSLLTAAAAFTGGIFLLAGRQTTRQGRQTVANLRQRHSALRTTARSNPTALSGADLALAVGIWGPLIFTGGPMADLGLALNPTGALWRSNTGSGAGGYYGGSCSGGGGSSCGGGGSSGGGGGCGG